MEKEINTGFEQFCINFYYDGFELTPSQLKDYKISLELMAKSFNSFLNSKFSLNEFAVNLNLSICDDRKIKELNSEYRSKDNVTDVLSFPLQENLRGGDYDQITPEIELGDLYVCESVCREQSKEFSISYQEEFIHLSTHGFLHVCGYDHEISETEEKLMESFEKEIILKM